ncbi:MAG: recombination protein RecR [Chlamydiia bacterium]|nr:recombination protein RecR [Chlamydiia bacterium]
MSYPHQLLKLMTVLKKLPGVGTKTAERYAFQLLEWEKGHLTQLATILQETPEKITHCSTCGCLIDTAVPCPFCLPERAANQSLCVIAHPKDVFAIEETNEYRGLYHVLGGVLSPIDGCTPESLRVPTLLERIQKHQIGEVIIAIDSTLEGDTTALFLKQELTPLQVKLSRLAFGIPMGSALDYIDGGTLARALTARSHF